MLYVFIEYVFIQYGFCLFHSMHLYSIRFNSIRCYSIWFLFNTLHMVYVLCFCMFVIRFYSI